MGDGLALLQFRPAYFERIWGGTKLRQRFGLDTPTDRTVGEAWLVADHAQHHSVVAQGPWEGATLRELVERGPRGLLGSRAKRTVHGRFPLLLKLLDAAQPLSVQVHPDDDDARRLGEPDVGKTEMWHVFHADPDSELICGLDPKVERAAFAQAVCDGSVEVLLRRFAVSTGTSVFVAAGTVHAIGGGLVLAEIQQNSDLTYRIYDWGRRQADGAPRALHLDKALEAIHFGASHGGPAEPLAYSVKGASCSVLAACRYFAAEAWRVSGVTERNTRSESFHILMGKSGELAVAALAGEVALLPGRAVLVPGAAQRLAVSGQGEWLDYYVPHIERDIAAPLREAGHTPEEIGRLGGAPAASGLSG